MRCNKAAILGLTASLVLAVPTPVEAANMDTVNAWLALPNRTWIPCEKALFPNWPYFFAFNAKTPLNPANGSPPGVCRESGQYVSMWTPPIKLWWVQLISNLKVDNTGIPNPPNPCTTGTAICYRDVVRVCSAQYAPPNPPAPPGTQGPCQNPAGIGPAGCEVCVTTDHT